MSPKIRRPGEGTYYQQPNGTWQYKITVGIDEETGKTIRKTFYGKTDTQAREKGLNWLRDRGGVRVNVSPDTKFDAWLTMWMETYKKGTIAPSAFHQLELLVKKIPERIKKKKVCDVTPIELQSFMNTFAATASKSYTDKMRTLLRASLREARENGLLTSDPARNLKAPSKQEAPREVFTTEEIIQICEYAATYKQEDPSRASRASGLLISTAVVFLLFTGLRRGELLGLMWSDLNEEDKIISIRRAVFLDDGMATTQEHKLKTPHSLRDIPYPDYLIELVKKLPKRSVYVFCRRSDGGLISPRNFSKAFSRFFANMKRDTGMEKQLSAHNCRHTFATQALKSGDIRVVQQLLGHSNISTTARYTHPDFIAKQEAVDNLVSGIFGKKDEEAGAAGSKEA